MFALGSPSWFIKRKARGSSFRGATAALITGNYHYTTGDVMVTALLDLTHGSQCNQTNSASSQSMNGILQTVQTLNSIQYIKGMKIGKYQRESKFASPRCHDSLELFIGIRIYDTCNQESRVLQAVLETTLEANLTQTPSCRAGAHLGNRRERSLSVKS